MSVYIRNYAMAAEYLMGGRMKDKYRPVSKNVYLARVDENEIALVLHSTRIVTYYAQGTAAVYTGGWWSVTTKAKIKEFTRLNPWGSGQYGVWNIGYTGEYTPEKIQKCRHRGGWNYYGSCKGTGTLQRMKRCDGPEGRYYYGGNSRDQHANLCEGNQVCVGETRDWPKTADGVRDYSAERVMIPCEHGGTEAHLLSTCAHDVDPEDHRDFHFIHPCEHGQWESHEVGIVEETCDRCQGTGTQDYGSKPIPVQWDDGPLLINDDGTLLGLSPNAVVSVSVWVPPRQYDHTTGMTKGQTEYSKPYVAPKPKPNHVGAVLADDLARLLPGLDAPTHCPVTNGQCDNPGAASTVRGAVVHLNDNHRWTREQIADWLDTLDVDLAFKVA